MLSAPDVAVLDICSSWISHFPTKPTRLCITGMNATEHEANEMADERSVCDLNADPRLHYDDSSFDAVTCAVSVDYLSRPREVFAEVARVLRPGGVFVCTFSNRCFLTKAIRGWLSTDDHGRWAIVSAYFAATPQRRISKSRSCSTAIPMPRGILCMGCGHRSVSEEALFCSIANCAILSSEKRATQ